MSVRIEGGCVAIGENLWRYDYTDNEGIHFLTFTGTQRPVIGDSVNNGVLVPKTGYIINNDPGFQKKEIVEDTW